VLDRSRQLGRNCDVARLRQVQTDALDLLRKSSGHLVDRNVGAHAVAHLLIEAVAPAHQQLQTLGFHLEGLHADRAVFDIETRPKRAQVERLRNRRDGIVEHGEGLEVGAKLALQRHHQAVGVDRAQLRFTVVAELPARFEVRRKATVQEARDGRVGPHRGQLLESFREARLVDLVVHLEGGGLTNRRGDRP